MPQRVNRPATKLNIFQSSAKVKKKLKVKHQFSEKRLLIRGQQIFQTLGTNSKFWAQED